VKVREVIRLIEDDDWMLSRTRSHRQYKHPTKPGLVTIPGKPGKDFARRAAAEHPQTGWPPRRPTLTIRSRAMPDTNAPSYLIVIERADDGGYGAWAPDLPGCVALGDTIEDAERQMREAIAFHLEGLREQGEPVPEPTAVAAVMLTTPAA